MLSTRHYLSEKNTLILLSYHIIRKERDIKFSKMYDSDKPIVKFRYRVSLNASHTKMDITRKSNSNFPTNRKQAVSRKTRINLRDTNVKTWRYTRMST